MNHTISHNTPHSLFIWHTRNTNHSSHITSDNTTLGHVQSRHVTARPTSKPLTTHTHDNHNNHDKKIHSTPGCPVAVCVQVHSAIEGQDVPGAHTRNLLEIHVPATSKLMADLRHPCCTALGVRCNKDVRRLALETAAYCDAVFRVHAAVSFVHQLQRVQGVVIVCSSLKC